MWCLEVIKHINKKSSQALPVELIKEQITQLNFNLHSYKVLEDPILYNDNQYNYIVPATKKGISFINQMLTDPKDALLVKELDIYLV
jgi:hypothetical protein